MKRVIVVEGIAGSGKTTLEKSLIDKVPGAVLLPEEETLLPIIHNHDLAPALEYLQKIIGKIIAAPATLVVVDRLHFTHAFRTSGRLDDFRSIEDSLRELNAIVLLLEVDPSAIEERMRETMEHRGEAWHMGKQGTLAERVAYYSEQQHVLQGFVAQSSLPVHQINTTDKDWETYTYKILKFLG